MWGLLTISILKIDELCTKINPKLHSKEYNPSFLTILATRWQCLLERSLILTELQIFTASLVSVNTKLALVYSIDYCIISELKVSFGALKLSSLKKQTNRTPPKTVLSPEEASKGTPGFLRGCPEMHSNFLVQCNFCSLVFHKLFLNYNLNQYKEQIKGFNRIMLISNMQT